MILLVSETQSDSPAPLCPLHCCGRSRIDRKEMGNGWLLVVVVGKIKTLKRQAYGYQDQEFFKLRILGIDEAKYALTG